MKKVILMVVMTMILGSCVKEDVKPQDITQEKSKERGILIKTSGNSDPKK